MRLTHFYKTLLPDCQDRCSLVFSPSSMLRWLSLALVLAVSHVASADNSLESRSLHQCRARAWVRAPDMVPGDIIAGDVKVKLIGPCTNAESYVLGLRYKERMFWKLRHQDAPLPEEPECEDIPVDLDPDLLSSLILEYNAQQKAYKESFENEELWTVHEEEHIAFEIKTTLVSVEGADSLPSSFISQFGILVPLTNYPPGLDYNQAGTAYSTIETDIISSESIYEYFVEIKFSNGTTSEVPAGITSFAPSYHSTESGAPVNVSLARRGVYMPGSAPGDMLQSNYTVELSFPDGPQVYQNSFMNLMAIVHRTGYTNRTDTPVELCASPNSQRLIEWRSKELKGRTSSIRFLYPLVSPSCMVPAPHKQYSRQCGNIDFTVPIDLSGEGHISSTSSEPIWLSFYVDHHAVLDLPTYYQKLKNRVTLDLAIKPDPLEPNDGYERMPLDDETADMDESDYDWVPWTPRRTFEPVHMTCVSYHGDTSISVIPMQKQRHLRPTPVHYLSGEARQPAFVAPSDVAELRLMSPEERDLIVPLAQPYTKVFAKGEELRDRYFAYDWDTMRRVIYVGDTWANKVVGEGQCEMDDMDDMEYSLVVQ